MRGAGRGSASPQGSSAAVVGVDASATSGFLFEDPEQYVLQFGYSSASGSRRPHLSLQVEGHEEEDGHTMYLISCSLQRPIGLTGTKFAATAWLCPKRLVALRDALHDVVKLSLGAAAYEANFAEAPFARHGGVPGTTARLRAWLAALASCVNEGATGAHVVAAVLGFLEAPVPEDAGAIAQQASSAASQAAAVPCQVCAQPVGSDSQDGRHCRRCLALRADAVTSARVRDLRERRSQASAPAFGEGLSVDDGAAGVGDEWPTPSDWN
mmetsp:Transcript_96073/g.309883  ORF Transcript_96073/g.309883 Transcript_96073/m.309883 type:complete len:268 (+) Transcript_96073:178-981(+)